MYVSVMSYSGLIMQGILFLANWSFSILYLFTAICIHFSLRWEEILIRNLGVPLASNETPLADESLLQDNYGLLVKNMNTELDSKKKIFGVVNWTWVLGAIIITFATIFQVVSLYEWGYNISTFWIFCILPSFCTVTITTVLVMALRRFKSSKKVNVVKFNLCQVFLQFIFLTCSLLLEILRKIAIIILFRC